MDMDSCYFTQGRNDRSKYLASLISCFPSLTIARRPSFSHSPLSNAMCQSLFVARHPSTLLAIHNLLSIKQQAPSIGHIERFLSKPHSAWSLQQVSNPDVSRDAQNCWSIAVYQRSVYQRLCDWRVCHELIFVLDEFPRMSLFEMELLNTVSVHTPVKATQPQINSFLQQQIQSTKRQSNSKSNSKQAPASRPN